MTIQLRPLTQEDGPQILAWRNMPEVSKYMYTDHIVTPEEHAGWLHRMLTLEDRRGFVVEVDGVGAGAAFVTDIDQVNKHAMWAFYLGGDVRGRGVGRAVETDILEFVFDNLKLHKLSAEVLGFNESVVRMHRKFGFIIEGFFHSHKWKQGAWHDVYRVAYHEETWHQRRSQLLAERAKLNELKAR